MPPPLSDEDLIEAFRAGNPGAFDQLVERHMKRIYALAFRMTGSHHDADDLAQEAFIRAHRGLARFRGEARFSTWLTRILLNLGRTPRRADLPLDGAREPAAAAASPLAGLVASEDRRRVRQAVACLPKRQRQTLVLRLFEGLRYREIAGVLGTTTGTAKANFFHALRGVARRLDAGEESP
ncbi:MAG: RNA polymerase sigma factor [Acidobacteriota bacterium]